MKKLIIPFVLAALFVLSAFTIIHPPELKMTEEYSVRIKGKRVNGFFHKMKGQIQFDEKNLNSSRVKMEVEVKSITTGNTLKSWNSKRRKWFNAKEFPTISFESDKFQKTQKGYAVNGKLKMKGMEQNVSVPFSFTDNIFYGSFYIRRSDFKVGKLKGFGKLVSDSIRIDFTIPVTK